MDGEASQSDTSIQVETIRRVPLDAKGVCGVCEKDSEGESLRCFGCDELYHVIGCTGKKRVTQTLLEQWGTIARNYSNVQFVCDACKHDKQAKKDIVLSNRLCVMEEQMTTMTDMILQIKNANNGQTGNNDVLTQEVSELKVLVQNLVQKSTADREVRNEPPPVSYASKAREKSVIVIKKKESGEKANIEEVQSIAVRTGSAVSKTYINETGDAVVVCENNDAQAKMKPALVTNMSEFKVVTPPARKPTINIAEIDKNYSKEELFAIIKAQNSSRGIEITDENFKILFLKPHQKDDKLFMAVVRVSDDIRDAIKHAGGDRVIVNSIACPVFNRFFVRRCNYCQGLNHWKDECKAQAPVCGKCAGAHETKNCTSDTKKCANCTLAGITDNNHEASFHNCKSYVNAQERLKSTINYFNKLN